MQYDIHIVEVYWPAWTVKASVNWSNQELDPTIIELFAFCIILSTELCNQYTSQQRPFCDEERSPWTPWTPWSWPWFCCCLRGMGDPEGQPSPPRWGPRGSWRRGWSSQCPLQRAGSITCKEEGALQAFGVSAPRFRQIKLQVKEHWLNM